MGKKIISLHVDSNAYDLLQQLVGRGNVSEKIDQLIKNYLRIYQTNNEAMDITRKKEEVALRKEKMALLSAEITREEEFIALYEQKMQETMQEEIAVQQAKTLEHPLCRACQEPITSKPIQLKYGLICKGCFLSASGKDITHWNRTPVEKEDAES